MSESFNETDFGSIPMSVTNEDLRNDITRLTEQVKQLTKAVAALTLIADGDKDRVTSIYAGLSVLRWAMGLIAAGLVWGFTTLNDAKNLNAAQEIRITNNEQTNHAQDIRLQALERGQFAEHMKSDR